MIPQIGSVLVTKDDGIYVECMAERQGKYGVKFRCWLCHRGIVVRWINEKPEIQDFCPVCHAKVEVRFVFSANH